jgi:hypothetical protein
MGCFEFRLRSLPARFPSSNPTDDFFDIGFRTGTIRHFAAPSEHHNPVGYLENVIQIVADQQHPFTFNSELFD